LLVRHGADVNDPAGGPLPPLALAAMKGQLHVARFLIDRGAAVSGEGVRPLDEAAYHGHLEVVRLLLEHGAPVSGDASTPLHAAAMQGRAEVARLLLEHGADPNAPNELGIRPLHDAASGGHTALVKLLLEHGADVNALRWEDTALTLALDKGHRETARFLRRHGGREAPPKS
jgi:ankyrin repeat protein